MRPWQIKTVLRRFVHFRENPGQSGGTDGKKYLEEVELSAVRRVESAMSATPSVTDTKNLVAHVQEAKAMM